MQKLVHHWAKGLSRMMVLSISLTIAIIPPTIIAGVINKFKIDISDNLAGVAFSLIFIFYFPLMFNWIYLKLRPL